MTTSPSSDPLKDTHNALLELHREIRAHPVYQGHVQAMNERQAQIDQLKKEMEHQNTQRMAFIESEFGARLTAANDAFVAAGGLPTLFPLR